jgi:hypothetical protein
VTDILELLEGVDLKLHLHDMGGDLAGGHDGLLDRADDGDVIILDHDRIMQAVAVVDPTANPDGILLDQPQARSRLAGLHQAGPVVLDRLCQFAGLGGDSAHPLDEVERHTLRR